MFRTLLKAGLVTVFSATIARAQAPAAVEPGAVPVPAQSAKPQTLVERAPTAEVLEKLALGDRAFEAKDFRAALFHYEDAAYLQPGYLASRLKMARAYLALRYPAQAADQAELVLAADPGNPEAAALLNEARNTRGRPMLGSAVSAPVAAAEEPKVPQRIVRATPPAPAVGGASAAPATAPVAPQVPLVAGTPAAPPTASRDSGPTAADDYRAALDLMSKHDWATAETKLTEAISLDPRLAVAYAARASARFGLGRYREAADDYKAALGLEKSLSTPLYGLGECYRLLGDPAAAEMYQRYADSKSRDVRDDLRAIAKKRAQELSAK